MSYDIVGFQDYTDFIILSHHKDNTIYLITKFILIFFSKKKGSGGLNTTGGSSGYVIDIKNPQSYLKKMGWKLNIEFCLV